jgi:hypothetical protein
VQVPVYRSRSSPPGLGPGTSPVAGPGQVQVQNLGPVLEVQVRYPGSGAGLVPVQVLGRL